MSPATLRHLRGDATRPQTNAPHIIAHGCNDRGKWGRGFVVPLAARYPAVRPAYLDWYAGRADNDFARGAAQLVAIGAGAWVANLVTQAGLYPRRGVPPIRYDAVAQALTHLSAFALSNDAEVHMPRIGAGLAGGAWPKIEAIIEGTLVDRGVSVVVYTFP